MSAQPAPTTILARIDALTQDLLRQLVEQTELLSTPSSSQSSQSSTNEPSGRPAKRRREPNPKTKPLALLSFPPSSAEAGGKRKNAVQFPTKSVGGVRRFGEPSPLFPLSMVESNDC